MDGRIPAREKGKRVADATRSHYRNGTPVAGLRLLGMSSPDQWRELGQQLRVDSIRAAAVPKPGHPTSSMSAADLMAVLISKYLRYDFDAPENPMNDHLVFSKGHASPLLYAIFKAVGAVTDEE